MTDAHEPDRDGTGEDAPVAIVTGAANGIGLATAVAMLDHGFRVVFADLQEAGATRAAAQHDPRGRRTLAQPVDVTDSSSTEAMVDATVARFGGLDVLINNAGLPAAHDVASITDEDWSGMLDVNLSGALRCARAAYPHLLTSSAPAIVNVSSLAGLVGMAGRAGYGTAKAGLLGLTRSLAAEWASAAIRVNAVAPGYVRTAGFDQRMLGEQGEQLVSELEAEVPLGRLCRPEEVASTIRFLASPDAGYITGQTIVIDGGMSVSARGR